MVLADVARPNGPGASSLNMLNAGWVFTTATPTRDGAYTLQAQAVAIFVQASWDQLNRPHRMLLELFDDERHHAQLSLATGDTQPARIEQEIGISPVPGAPNGTPGLGTFVVEIAAGTLHIPVPRRRYIWRATIGESVGEAGFWVNAPQPPSPIIGAPPPRFSSS